MQTRGSASSHATLFLANLPEERRVVFARAASALDEALDNLLAEARAISPSLVAEAFLPFVARNLSTQMASVEDLVKLQLGDMLLVYGYGRNEPAAIEVIERQYLPDIARSLRPYSLSVSDVAEILQLLRHLLWASHVPQPGTAPYSGRGELLGWLRITALRRAGHITQKGRKHVELSEQEALEENLAGSPELQLLKAQYRDAFRHAFDAAMTNLTNKERNLLRYACMDGLSIDGIAAIYKVHRATAARWLTQTRETLLKQTKKNLRTRGVVGVDLDEILRLIWSQIDVSIRHHLLVHPE